MTDTLISIHPAEFKRLPLFRSVSIHDVEDILLRCPVLRVEKGRVIIAAGQSNERMYIVLRGEVSVRLGSPDTPAVAQLGPGEIIGEMSVIDGEPTSAFVVAEEKCRLLCLDRDALWELFRRTPYLANNMLTVLTQRIRNSNKSFEQMRQADDATDSEDNSLDLEPC